MNNSVNGRLGIGKPKGRGTMESQGLRSPALPFMAEGPVGVAAFIDDSVKSVIRTFWFAGT